VDVKKPADDLVADVARRLRRLDLLERRTRIVRTIAAAVPRDVGVSFVHRFQKLRFD